MASQVTSKEQVPAWGGNDPEGGVSGIHLVAQKVADAAKLYAKHVHPSLHSPAHFHAFLKHLGITPPAGMQVTGGGQSLPRIN